MSDSNPSGSAMAALGIGVKLGGSKDPHQPHLAIESMQDRLEAERTFARQLRKDAGYVAAAAQPAWGFMSFENVVQGRLWEVLFISIYGADPTVALAGQAMGYISSFVPQDSATPPVFPNLVLTPANFPLVQAPSRRQILIWPTERLVIPMKGLPNNAQVHGSISVIEYEISTFLKELSP